MAKSAVRASKASPPARALPPPTGEAGEPAAAATVVRNEDEEESAIEAEADVLTALPVAEEALAPIVAEAEVLPPPRRARRKGASSARESSSEDGDDADTDADEPVTASKTGLAPLRSPVQRFLAEARAYPRLSDEEEKRLIHEVRERGDTHAARTLVVHNLRLVISIAYQYRQAWTNVLDLFQEGSVGLLEAVKHWDPTLGTRFGSYAAYWIRAYILRFLMTNARLIHVGNTRAGRKLFFRLERERQKLLAAGVDVTPKLLAAKLDVPIEDVEEVSAHLASREVSFDPPPGDEGLGLEERIPGATVSPESQAARSEMSTAIARLMSEFAATLSDARERAIWHEHLAAADEALPLGALGERFGVSKQRMGQIADKVKKRFREKILSDLGSDIQLEWQKENE